MTDKILFGSTTFSDLLTAIGIFLVAFIIAKVLTIRLKKIMKARTGKEDAGFFLKALYYIIIISAVFASLSVMKIDLTGLMVAGGVAGFIIGFASQNIIGNLVSGIFIMIERPIRIGNQVSVHEVDGFVEDITMISTMIRTYDGLSVRIPNEKIFTTNIVNYVRNIARRVQYTVGIRYSDDAYKAIDIIRGILDGKAFVLVKPEPHIFVDELGDNSVNIIVRYWAPVSEWWELKMELLNKIKLALEQNGIEIAFPQRVIWQGNDENNTVSTSAG